jgi:hypothetical protein
MSVAEIGCMRGKPLGNVKVGLHRVASTTQNPLTINHPEMILQKKG